MSTPSDGSASDLDQLRAAFVPRDAALCSRLAHVIVPTGNLVTAAIFLVSFGTLLAALPAVGVGYIVYQIMPAEADGTRPLVVYAAAAALVVSLFAVWLRFARWAGGRRSAARALFRDGQFVQATVKGMSTVPGRRGPVGTSVAVTFPAERQTLAAQFFIRRLVKSVGHDGALPLLYRAGYDHAVTFPIGGEAVHARIAKL